jgi:hypothetical protein
MADSGSIRQLRLRGISLDVAADCNITFNRSKYEKDASATSGDNRFKVTKRVQKIEGLEVNTTPAEMELLDAVAGTVLTNVTMSIELADTSVYRASGQVFFDTYESMDGKSKVTLLPKRDWTPFLP